MFLVGGGGGVSATEGPISVKIGMDIEKHVISITA